MYFVHLPFLQKLKYYRDNGIRFYSNCELCNNHLTYDTCDCCGFWVCHNCKSEVDKLVCRDCEDHER
jgi:hypothetical protein